MKMKQKIEGFGSQCCDIQKSKSGPEGLEQTQQGLDKILMDEDISSAF